MDPKNIDAGIIIGGTFIALKITCDPAKRARTLDDRGLDFADPALVSAGETLNAEDRRQDYGETRIQRSVSGRSHGDDRLDAAWRRPAQHFDEESQCERTSHLSEAM